MIGISIRSGHKKVNSRINNEVVRSKVEFHYIASIRPASRLAQKRACSQPRVPLYVFSSLVASVLSLPAKL